MNETLRAELLEMQRIDQAMRQEFRAGRGQLEDEVDKRNVNRLKEILLEHGWPTKTLVGEDGSRAAWVITQHADHDRPFQRHCLELVRDAAERGETDWRSYAYLEDRIRFFSGQKQRYGTQLREEGYDCAGCQPLEEPEQVHVLRVSMGLEALQLNIAFYLADRYARHVLKQEVDGPMGVGVIDSHMMQAVYTSEGVKHRFRIAWDEEKKECRVIP